MTLKPTWNWRSALLIGISSLLWLMFALMTALLSGAVIKQIIAQRTLDSAAGIFLAAALSLASFFWAKGLLQLLNIRYQVRLTDSDLVWKKQGFLNNRETKINLASIEFLDHHGSPAIGYSLVIKTQIKRLRLGSFLSRNDIYQLSKVIEKAKSEQGITH